MFSYRIIHLDAGYRFYPLSFHSLKMHEESCRQAPNESSESLPWTWQCCLRQGVRQGGILSTELYKVYLDGCLRRLAEVKGGFRIGEICCAAPTCADDVADISNTLEPINGVFCSRLQRDGTLSYSACQTGDIAINIGSKPMPIVSESMHMGILRSANSQESAIQDNIKKARRTIHSLMGAGLQGENGLDPDTSIHLLQTYVVPVLVYGLGVVLPNGVHLDKLERLHKRFLKQILSLPQTVADPAVYILSGAIPLEAVIHSRALTLFGSICRLDESTVEKRLARRQLSVKSCAGNSWFVDIRRLCVRYSLADPYAILDCPPSKFQSYGENLIGPK